MPNEIDDENGLPDPALPPLPSLLAPILLNGISFWQEATLQLLRQLGRS